MLKSPKLVADGRIWLNIDGQPFIGTGKVELIQKIEELGSLRKAATAMKMSYRQAWQSVKQMNELSGKPLVILNRGGKEGGTAKITDEGQLVVQNFRKLENKFIDFLNNFQQLNEQGSV
jgi:molybdate transport system regulatory protein